MYSQEFKDRFRSAFVEMAKNNDIFEGVIQVGGIGGNSNKQEPGAGLGSILTHVPVSACLYNSEDLEKGENAVRTLVENFGNAYIQRELESPEHIKLDTFIEGGLNVTLHIEVTSSLRIKSGNYEILLDKTGNLHKAAPVGSIEEEQRFKREEESVDKSNSKYYGIFYPLRRCEQNLLRGDLFTAELHLSQARLELMKLRGRIDKINLRAAFPSYGKLDPEFLAKLKATYPKEITENAIIDAAQAILDLYEENAGLDGNPVCKSLYYLFYEEKLPKKHKEG